MIYETVRGRPIELTVKHTGLHCQKFVVDVVGPSWNLVTALVVALTALAGAWFQQTPLYLFLVLALLLFHFNGKVHQGLFLTYCYQTLDGCTGTFKIFSARIDFSIFIDDFHYKV